MYKIAITNRHICNNLLSKISELERSEYNIIILREKDMPESEYLSLAKRAIGLSSKIILHSFINVSEELNYKKIHLPFNAFCQNIDRLKDFHTVGVSTHTIDEAVRAESLGADYITSSHIFATDCKKGLEPKGLEFLKNVCNSVNIPVYALGGINSENAELCIKTGAKGVCMMSQAMM